MAEATKKIEALIQKVRFNETSNLSLHQMIQRAATIPPLQSPSKPKSHLDKNPIQEHQQNLEKTTWTEEEKKNLQGYIFCPNKI